MTSLYTREHDVQILTAIHERENVIIVSNDGVNLIHRTTGYRCLPLGHLHRLRVLGFITGPDNTLSPASLHLTERGLDVINPNRRPGRRVVARAKTHEHCWHDTGSVHAMHPPEYDQVCCDCGERRRAIRPPDAGRTHGRFLPANLR
ncbi:hypothetical protein [Deinococcus yunweiensis]|uniref:hypothetical protein n=1 Tax=Deinococcus yunweiensis TaxID=367282 RepID=UPI00398EC849